MVASVLTEMETAVEAGIDLGPARVAYARSFLLWPVRQDSGSTQALSGTADLRAAPTVACELEAAIFTGPRRVREVTGQIASSEGRWTPQVSGPPALSRWSKPGAFTERDPLEYPWQPLATCYCLMGVGVVLIAAGDALAAHNSAWGQIAFWLGMAAVWIPSAARVVGTSASRSERILVLALLVMFLYIAQVLFNPSGFTPHDPFLWDLTTTDILHTGTLFNPNPLLPVSPLYPGLAATTAALVTLTGLSTFAASMLIIGVAQILFALALFLLYERVGRSSWIAGVATLVYLTNPQFTFDQLYAYESLALPLAIALFYRVLQGLTGAENRKGHIAVVLILILALDVTHHLTSFILTGLLLLTALMSMVVQTPK